MTPVIKGDLDRPVPQAVLASIQKAFGHDSHLFHQAILALRYDPSFGCFCFEYAGMYVGVEEDGHMHT